MDRTEKKMDDTTEEKMEGSKKHRIPERYVRLILDLPATEPIGPWQDAALVQRTYDSFAPFQERVWQEWRHKGYVEVDYDYAAAHIAKAQEEDMVLWEELKKERDLRGIRFADRNDPVYGDFYAPFDPEEEEAVEQAAVGE